MAKQPGTKSMASRSYYTKPQKGKPSGLARSYRPISLISCIGKLAERMVNNRLYWYLEKSNTPNQHQAGFKMGGCTEDQLFILAQDIQNGFTVTIFVELQQAYDTVLRKGLLKKIANLALRGKLYKSIKFFSH
ncbi:RNA-directed DNA polymerase from mobile element jockey [Elysia marginata]|uniref:RNA-directed DNA polymerase from mobile element jockey n=1 Tax=Elysia marginata TaxID=1093978 RepID=A0AAV4IWB5_9GAST|nr:RNA-directed DNA polymerase from mobile element jockey [Elysia marginata]